MILVTVGTSHYDPLIEEMDRLVGEGIVSDTVVAQIGRGHYQPRNMRFFRFISSLNKAYQHADLIISTGGAGTTMECVRQGRPLIVIENKTLMEGHQAQLIGEMSRRGHLIACKSLAELPECISEARKRKFTKFVGDECRIHKLILQLLK
ncbi:MAG: hypothetical protein HXY34_09145 [Candidatus Thorarchaeota archaeon]|nr:hypothetical protein [Candidatus Thorarchaeota archaeon]